MKNIVIIGGSYVGLATAQELIKRLPLESSDHRIIVVEKNSHFSHLFAYPRFAVVPNHEHKAFLPFPTMLPSPHLILSSTTALSISSPQRIVTLLNSSNGEEFELDYEVLVLATGTRLSPPGTIPGKGTKREGVEYLKGLQGELERGEKIVVLGGGAIGVQMVCDLAELYEPRRKAPGSKSITLVHSHNQVMNRFHPRLSEIIKERFKELGVEMVLGSRARIPGGGNCEEGKRVWIETEDGRRVEADCIVQSTGQTPNSQLVESFAPSCVAQNGFISVDEHLRIVSGVPEERQLAGGRIFAIGDIADTGAQKAARPALMHSQVLARNILASLSGKDPSTFESIVIAPSAIHLTLGFKKSIIFRNPPRDVETGEWRGEPTIVWKDDGTEDMGIEGVWDRRLGMRKRETGEYHL